MRSFKFISSYCISDLTCLQCRERTAVMDFNLAIIGMCRTTINQLEPLRLFTFLIFNYTIHALLAAIYCHWFNTESKAKWITKISSFSRLLICSIYTAAAPPPIRYFEMDENPYAPHWNHFMAKKAMIFA